MKALDELPPYASAAKVAAALDVSSRHIQRLALRGEIPSACLGGRRLINTRRLAEMLRENEAAQAS